MGLDEQKTVEGTYARKLLEIYAVLMG